MTEKTLSGCTKCCPPLRLEKESAHMEKRADGLANVISIKQRDGKRREVETSQDKRRREKSRKSVYIYVATLFLAVFLFMLLSYFMQQRNNSEISWLNEKNATAQQKIENLQNAMIQLQAENAAYEKQVADLQAQISELEGRIIEIRKAWRADVQSVLDADREAYNDLLEKYNELAETNKDKVKK